MKICPSCHSELPPESFYKVNSRRDGLSGFCQECTKARAKAWRANNLERAKAAQARVYQNNREKVIHQATEWNRNNPERRSRITQRYASTHLEQLAEKEGRRQVLLRRILSEGSVSEVDLAKLRERSCGRCVYCGESTKLVLDHVRAIARGGVHRRSNLIPSCTACNSSKRDVSVRTWLFGKHGYNGLARLAAFRDERKPVEVFLRLCSPDGGG